MGTVVIFICLSVILFIYGVGYWEYFGDFPKLVKICKKQFWPAVIVPTVFLALLVIIIELENEGIDSTKDWNDVLFFILLLAVSYWLGRLGRQGAKKYEQKKKVNSPTDTRTSDIPDYWNWGTVYSTKTTYCDEGEIKRSETGYIRYGLSNQTNIQNWETLDGNDRIGFTPMRGVI